MVATRYWFNRLSCPNDAILAYQHSHQTVGFLLGQSANWMDALAKVASNFNLQRYLGLVSPTVEPMAHWLLYHQVTEFQESAFKQALDLLWGLVLVASGASIALVAWQARKIRHLPPQVVLAVILFATAVVWCFSQLRRNAYEASFVLPMVMLAFVLALSAPHGSRLLARATVWLTCILVPAMLVSEGLIAVLYGPDLSASAHQHAILEKHYMSVPVFGYQTTRADILGAARQCGLSPARHASNLMVDDTTYFAFMESPRPQHQLSILDPLARGTITDPIAYLRSRGSAGAILSCHWLPPELARRAHRQGAFCCLAPPGW